MTFYILTRPGEEPVYPFTLTDLRRLHPEVSWPVMVSDEDAAAFHCHPVQDTAPPAEEGMVPVRVAPELVDGVWEERWALEPAPPPPLPAFVTLRQAREALILRGLFDDVEAAIEAITDPMQRKVARNRWEYSNEVNLSDTVTQMIADILGLTEEEKAELLVFASTL